MSAVSMSKRYEFVFAIPRPQLWACIRDARIVAACAPGCESVIEIEPERQYRVQLKKKVGPFFIRMQLEALITQAQEPDRLVTEVTGQDRRLRTTVTQTIIIDLEPGADSSQTRMTIDIRFSLEGLLASLGARLLESHIDQELSLFIQNFQLAMTQNAATPTQSIPLDVIP